MIRFFRIVVMIFSWLPEPLNWILVVPIVLTAIVFLLKLIGKVISLLPFV